MSWRMCVQMLVPSLAFVMFAVVYSAKQDGRRILIRIRVVECVGGCMVIKTRAQKASAVGEL